MKLRGVGSAVVSFIILSHNRTWEPSRELWTADGGIYLRDTRLPESYIHFHSTWLVKLRHPYFMSCSCFPENLLSPTDPSLLPCHTNHLFLICFPCGPWHPFSCGCHSGVLRNAWIPFKEHVKQWMGGQRQLTRELNCPCGGVALKICQRDSLQMHMQLMSA